NGLEWRRTLPIDPAADLIGATYTRADGQTTVALSVDSGEAERLYRRATNPNYGKDPLRIDRPSRDRLEVRIFPVAPSATVKLVAPTAVAAELGLTSVAGVTLRLASVESVTNRIAPESLPAAGEPTIVMGRAWSATKVQVRVEAVGSDGKTLATRRVGLP